MGGALVFGTAASATASGVSYNSTATRMSFVSKAISTGAAFATGKVHSQHSGVSNAAKAMDGAYLDVFSLIMHALRRELTAF